MGGVGSGASPKQYPLETVAEVQRRYENGQTQAEIASALGLTQKIVWNLMRRHGLSRRVAAKRDQRGQNNTSWKGDAASYSAFHLRVAAERGQPSVCEQCGRSDDAVRYEWANLTGRYEDVNDYKRMCQPCHHAFDDGRHPNNRRDALGRYVRAGGGGAQCL